MFVKCINTIHTHSNLFMLHNHIAVFPWWFPDGKESACQWRRNRFNPWVRKVLWRRKGQPTPIFLPVKSHGHSPRNLKESDTTATEQQQSYSQSIFEPDSILSCFLNSSAKYAACSKLNYHFIITLIETWPSSFSPFWGVDGNLFNNLSNNLRAILKILLCFTYD